MIESSELLFRNEKGARYFFIKQFLFTLNFLIMGANNHGPWFTDSEEACEGFGVSPGDEIITPNGERVTVVGREFIQEAGCTNHILYRDEDGNEKYHSGWDDAEDFEALGFRKAD